MHTTEMREINRTDNYEERSGMWTLGVQLRDRKRWDQSHVDVHI